MSEVSLEIFGFVYPRFNPSCVVRHSSLVFAQSRLWRNGFPWKIREAEKRSGEWQVRDTNKVCGCVCRSRSILISTSKRGWSCLSHIYMYAASTYTCVRTFARVFDVRAIRARDSAREREILNKLAGLQTRQRALFPRKVPRVSTHKRLAAPTTFA